MAFSAFYNDIPHEERRRDLSDPDQLAFIPIQTTLKGKLVFATNLLLTEFADFQKKELVSQELTESKSETKMGQEFNPLSIDFAPFMMKSYTEVRNIRDQGKPDFKP